MVTKEIMSGVNKAKAREFMDRFKTNYVGFPMGKDFAGLVVRSLIEVGINVDTITSGTANSVVDKMERKSGISL